MFSQKLIEQRIFFLLNVSELLSTKTTIDLTKISQER